MATSLISKFFSTPARRAFSIAALSALISLGGFADLNYIASTLKKDPRYSTYLAEYKGDSTKAINALFPLRYSETRRNLGVIPFTIGFVGIFGAAGTGIYKLREQYKENRRKTDRVEKD